MRIKQHGNLYQLTFLPRLFPINAYVYETADALIVLDMGTRNFVKGVKALEAKTAKPVTHLLITHGHSDHVSGISVFAKAYPDAEIVVSAREARILRGDLTLDDTEDQSPISGGWPELDFDIHREVIPGDQVAGFQVVGVPGHTPGSVAYLAPDGTMIAGDAFQTRGGLAVAGDLRIAFPFPAWATWSRKEALASAEVVLKLNPSCLALGHGPLVLNPDVELPPVIKRMKERLEHA